MHSIRKRHVDQGLLRAAIDATRDSAVTLVRLLSLSLMVAYGVMVSHNASAAIIITEIHITTPNAPINSVGCPGTLTVSVDITYYIESGTPEPHELQVEVWERDLTFFAADDKLSDGIVVVLDKSYGTKHIEIPLNCGPPKPNCTCDFFGNRAIDDESGQHDVYLVIAGVESNVLALFCNKPDGETGCIDADGPPGSAVAMQWHLRPASPMASVDMELTYDPSALAVTSASWDPTVSSYFSSSSVDISTSGVVRFLADNPSDVAFDSLGMLINFQIGAGAPLGPTGIYSYGSVFRTAAGVELTVTHGSGIIVVTNGDVLPPNLHSDLIYWEPQSKRVVGLPGAVEDDYLGQGPGYVGVEVRDSIPSWNGAVGSYGRSSVNSDGSFEVPGLNLLAAQLPIEIVARDGMDNVSTFRVMPNLDPSGVEPVSPSVSTAVAVVPNPSTGEQELRVSWNGGAVPIEARLFDVHGRFISTVLNERIGPGGVVRAIRGVGGRTLASGVYYLRVSGPGVTRTIRTVITH